ncbi:hypothetical protein [Burkholderia sp. MSMB1835]|uniref:hypothetical protein n=1 Tax=Burkholderia sp. MSMB1835 TaxID=1637876 RepID=UPI0007584FB4|nr:hypothetical protein [Burkholderia sp. MSMB1835]KVL41185.1 hypothetical protein WS96_01495 [Burkholderia sp. MSMB1835]
MRELTMMEINEVSGGGVMSRLGASVLGGMAGIISGTAKGAVVGGAQGGLLGVGLVSGAAGMVVGAVYGAVSGAVYGLVNDAPQTLKVFNTLMENVFDWLAPTPK